MLRGNVWLSLTHTQSVKSVTISWIYSHIQSSFEQTLVYLYNCFKCIFKMDKNSELSFDYVRYLLWHFKTNHPVRDKPYWAVYIWKWLFISFLHMKVCLIYIKPIPIVNVTLIPSGCPSKPRSESTLELSVDHVCCCEVFLADHVNYSGKLKKTICENLNCTLRFFFFFLRVSVACS